MSETVLALKGLQVSFPTPEGRALAVQDVGFQLRHGETLGIVGESGSGKTMTALSIMGLVPQPGLVEGGSIEFNGLDLRKARARQLRLTRGSGIAMIFQEPMTSLHPTLRVGFQIEEAIRAHDPGLSRSKVETRVTTLLDRVGIPEPDKRANEFPHTWSGGMRQRAMIAMAVANRPVVLIADEPTTSLDVTIQAQVLELLREMREETGAGLIIISHDLGVMAEMADRVAVMYGGRIVETGSLDEIYSVPLHPYTAGLMASVPRLDGEVGPLPSIPGRPPDMASLPSGCSFHPRCRYAEEVCSTLIPEIDEQSSRGAACFFSEKLIAAEADRTTAVSISGPPAKTGALLEIDDLYVHYRGRHRLFEGRAKVTKAVDGVSFTVGQGETLGLVGESGCGKTTIARAILRLVDPTDGQIRFKGADMAHLEGSDLRRIRRDIQAVFQDPFGSLNPRMTVSRIVASPLEIHGGLDRREITERVRDLLGLVSLGRELEDRYPAALSGGQRQRVGIARALALEPALLVLDEPLSALDVSIQAQILNLLRDLQDRLGLSYLLIAHDLAAVRYLADRVAVMYLGRIVESGQRDEIYSRPAHPYTKALLSAVPVPSPGQRSNRVLLEGELPEIGDRSIGCRFASRCFRAEERCLDVEPSLRGESHSCACFFPLVETA